MDNEEVMLSSEEELLSTEFDRDLHISLSQSYESDVENLDKEKEYQEEVVQRIKFSDQQLKHRLILEPTQSRGSVSSTDSGSSVLVPRARRDKPAIARQASGIGADAEMLPQKDSLDYTLDEDESGTDTDAEAQARREYSDIDADNIPDDGLAFDTYFTEDTSTSPQRRYESVDLNKAQEDASDFGSSDEITLHSTDPEEQNEHVNQIRGAETGPTRRVASFSQVKVVESELDTSLSMGENQQEHIAQRLGTPYYAERMHEARIIRRHEGLESTRDHRSNHNKITKNYRNKPPMNVCDGKSNAEEVHWLQQEHRADDSDDYNHNSVKQEPLPGARIEKWKRSKLSKHGKRIDQGRQDEEVEFLSRSHTHAMDIESSHRITLTHHSKIPVRIHKHQGHGENEEKDYESIHSAMQQEYNNMLLQAALQKPSGNSFAEHPKHGYSLYRNNEGIAHTAIYAKEQANNHERVTLKDNMVNSAASHVSKQSKDILEANKQSLGRKPLQPSSYLQMHRRQRVDPAERKLLWKRQEAQSGSTTALCSIHDAAQERDMYPSSRAIGPHGQPQSTSQHCNLSKASVFSHSKLSNTDGRHQLLGQFPAQSHHAAATFSFPVDETHAVLSPALRYPKSGHASSEPAENPFAGQHHPLYGLIQGVFLENAGHTYTFPQIPDYVPGQAFFSSIGHDEMQLSNLSRNDPLQRAVANTGEEQWMHEQSPGSASPHGERIPRPALCYAEQQRRASERHTALHTLIPPFGTRCNSDGCLDKLQQQAQQKNYKEYTLQDYKNLKQDIKLGGLGPDAASVKEKLEKIKKQQNYTKRVHKQNRLLLGRREVRTLVHSSSAPEVERKSRREQALEYARNVPRPHCREERQESSAPRDEHCDSPPSSAQVDPIQVLLDDLIRRHEKDKQAVAAFRIHAP